MNQNILIGLERQAEKLVLQIPNALDMVLQIPDAMDSNEYRSLFNEKFAELIVKECAELCDRFQERDVGMQPAECAGAIRQMFGVEK